MEQKNRILWVDVAKGICMLSIIAGHFGVSWINDIVFSYHLTLFFFLSGYTLKTNLSAENVQKRFNSLMIPYFITCTAIIIMDLINTILLITDVDLASIFQLISNDLLRSFMASGTYKTFGAIEIGSRIGAIWYLPATFFAIIYSQFLLEYIPNTRQRYIIAFALSVLSSISARFIWLPFSIQSAIFAAPVILIGYDARQNDFVEKITFNKALFCSGIFLLGIVMGVSPIYYVVANSKDYILSAVCAVASSTCVLYAARILQKSKILAWIGRNSIYWLCLHLFELETMGTWFQWFLNALGITPSGIAILVLKLLFICTGTALILLLKKWKAQKTVYLDLSKSSRDDALDLAKAALIILMIIGHFPLAEPLRTIIYSFHMATFVIYSGYCFKSQTDKTLIQQLSKEVKRFVVPYALFGIGYLALTQGEFFIKLKRVLFGISFTKTVFTDVASIGPVYFILLLFVTKVIYLLLGRFIKDEKWKAASVLGLSLLGVYLGKIGYWLPWSADCSLYALAFYYIGHCIHKYGIMDIMYKNGWSYFILSSIWVYMIYKGGMEIAVRNYGNYGLVILGAACASILLYMLCKYLCTALPPISIQLACKIGQNTMYILIVHKLLSPYIRKLVELRFAYGSVVYAILMILLQLGIGTVIGMIMGAVQKFRFKR